MSALLRHLPSVSALLLTPELQGLPHEAVVAAARDELETLRREVLEEGREALPEDIPARVAHRARQRVEPRLVPVLNATGVVIHTNLGRAPWAPEAVAHAAAVARGYTNLEMDLESGQRGERLTGVRHLLAHLTGAEDAVVVNNNAAAVLLALTALARGGEVLVSRGELVEIGGSFRVPEVIASGGASLVEVGATNRTRVRDYEAGMGEASRVLLRVHPSNFRIVGFTERPQVRDLVALAERHGVVLVDDIGSGALQGAFDEPSVSESIAAGVHAVCFSGDKLLGGPQAGIVVGRHEVIQRLRKHPMYRALRCDKVILAALEATLALHARGEHPPVPAMLSREASWLQARAEALTAALTAAGLEARVDQDVGYTGGGALPAVPLPTAVAAVSVAHPSAVAQRLRTAPQALVCRVADDTLRLDPRTLPEDADATVASLVAAAVSAV